ncbi:MAG: hypothetical protein EXR76_20255 [Myxococcales bacterium]|nr:hypothetical protein [Myxococcales bacterium]
MKNSTPSPDGTSVYFTGYGDEAGSVYKVGEMPGEPTIVSAAFVLPMDLITSTNGDTLFVADVGYENEAGLDGVIYRVASAGGVPEAMETTAGYDARGLDLVVEQGEDVLYFSGKHPMTGAAGVFKSNAAGGVVTVVAEGDAFADPSGIAVTAGGDVFVADTVATGRSGLYRVTAGAAERLEIPYALGYPAGLALSQDGNTLFISAQNTTNGNATVVTYGLADGLFAERANDVIGANLEAGGLHRGQASARFSWCGTDDAGAGSVFLLIGQ